MSEMNALVGLDFSLIGTKLHAAYEKKGEDGYSILLMPTVQEADNGVSIGEVINDIKKLVGKDAGTDKLEDEMAAQLGVSEDRKGLNAIIVKLNMAYLYMHKEKESQNNVLEYAFQLEVITKGLIPAAVAQIIDVTNLSLSIWQTDRKKVVEQMQLMTISDYLGLPVAEPENA